MPISLVGHSNGGDTAMYFAMRHPEQVSVVTLDNACALRAARQAEDPSFFQDPNS
jgi:pimeloyl-ACP methyl ester carboxylesterase